MSYPFGIAKVYAPTPHHVFGGRIYRRTPDVALPLEPRRVLILGGRAGPARRPAPENRVHRTVDLIVPPVVVDRGQKPFVVAPAPRRAVEAQKAFIQRNAEVVIPLVEFARRPVVVHAPLQPRRPLTDNRVPSRVPDVVLPLEYRRGVIRGGHSLRVPDYSGVRA